MNGYYSRKKYKPSKIPERQQIQLDDYALEIKKAKTDRDEKSNDLADSSFYVIDYSLSEVKGAGKYVLNSQQIKKPERDKAQDQFYMMRNIARVNNFQSDYNRFFSSEVRRNMARIFCRQGMYMKDFSDNYSEKVPFSSYYPNYQVMSYEQFRTYFTWRDKVRQGSIEESSLSYAFLYIYELLNQIGVDELQAGLNLLLHFWRVFREYNRAVDKYVLRWMKDYHIYYPLHQSFSEFIRSNNLSSYYSETAVTDDDFSLYCAASKYDIRHSAFFADENESPIIDCFYFVLDKMRSTCDEINISFDDMLLQPDKKLSSWQPFRDALFFPGYKQPDRRIVISDREIYVCSQDNWVFSSNLTSNSGKQIISYIIKRMESVLREKTKYKYKLSVRNNLPDHPLMAAFSKAGISIEQLIIQTVDSFYKDATKTVVTVDQSSLARIRQDALETQKKLIVPDQEPHITLPHSADMLSVEEVETTDKVPVNVQLDLSKISDRTTKETTLYFKLNSKSDMHHELSDMLSKIEIEALKIILEGNTDIKQFADQQGIMLEVLADSINEKSIDVIGDYLLDNELLIFDDYINLVKEMVAS